VARKVIRSWFRQDLSESLFKQPLKTGLTFMAVGIGMLSLCLLLSILSGLQQRVRQQVGEIGADVAMVKAGGDKGSAFALTRSHAEIIRNLLPGSPCAEVKIYELKELIPGARLHVIAAGIELPGIRGWTLQDGRWLDEADHASGESHAVISSAVAEQLLVKTGDIFPLREKMLRVAGIMKGAAGLPGETGTDVGALFVLVPPRMPAWWITEPPDSLTYDAIFIKNRTHDSMEALARRLQSDFEKKTEGGAPRWTLTTPDSLIASTRRMMQTVEVVYGSIAFLCLMLGGVTLSSLMMSNVQQRIAEIGLRMSIGASWRDIFILFLSEGLVTTLAAGLGGVLVAILVTRFIRESIELPVHIGAMVVVLPLIAAALLGLLFSWYPARTAASITPADALRND